MSDKTRKILVIIKIVIAILSIIAGLFKGFLPFIAGFIIIGVIDTMIEMVENDDYFDED